ncbi:MAG: branched-chain amino acid ABC transporter substrate-binding protein [Anaerolineae bacterium]|jgi:branched-chain amino acid transport system substrate-binding protein
MRLREKRAVIVLAILASLLLTACNGGEPERVTVAVSMPLGLEIGQDMLNAAQLAVDEADGLAGDVVVEVVELSNSDPEGSPVSVDLESEIAQEAVTDTAIVGYIGPATSDQARVSMPILNQASIAQIAPAATWPGLTKPGFGPGEPGIYYPTGRRHFFRVVPSDEIQGEVAARWAGRLGFDSVYIVDDSTAYGSGVAGIFEVSAQDLDIEVLGHSSFDGSTPDEAEIAAVATSALDAAPDLVFLGSSVGFGGDQFVGSLRGLDREIDVMMPDGMLQDELITIAGTEAVEGIYATTITVPADQLESATDFRTSYREAYGKEPPPFAVTTYEAMSALLHAIEQAEEPTRDGVLTALSNMGSFSGILGDWEFDNRGDISITTISGMQIQDGNWTFVQVVE